MNEHESQTSRPPRVWLLLGHKAGDNNQVLALADALVQFLASGGGADFRTARSSRASGLTPL